MRSVIAVAAFSFVSGMLTHLAFYPLVRSWRNERVRLLGRPAIGVAATAVPFALWVRTLTPPNAEDPDHHAAVGLAAYLAAFVTFGGGTACGYLLDDLREERERGQNDSH